MVDETEDMTHLAYIGDSILRTSFCGHLWPGLHNGSIDGACTYSGDIAGYHYSAKAFTHTSASGREVQFDQLFVPGQIESGFAGAIDELAEPGKTPLTHVIINIGMWLAHTPAPEYHKWATWLLEHLVDHFGTGIKIAWIDTPSISAGIFCWEKMKRETIQMHSFYAEAAIGHLKARYPDLWIAQVDAFKISDDRPDTSSDGR